MVNLTLCIIDRLVCSTYLMLWEFGAACCVGRTVSITLKV